MILNSSFIVFKVAFFIAVTGHPPFFGLLFTKSLILISSAEPKRQLPPTEYEKEEYKSVRKKYEK